MYDVARGIYIRGDAQMIVGDETPVFVKVNIVQKVRCRFNTDAYDHQIGLESLVVIQHDGFDASVAVKTGDMCVKLEFHPVLLMDPLDKPSYLLAENLYKRNFVRRDDGYFAAAHLQAAGRFHSDKAGSDDNYPFAFICGRDNCIAIGKAA